MFSRRLPPSAEANALTIRLAELRASGVSIVDLTDSNPTLAGFAYDTDLLHHLARPEGLRYAPAPLGMTAVREAVAADYHRRGATVEPDTVVLTASTSDAYSWLFKLLCNPGENVLVPRPSYPLFEHLTRLDGVATRPYNLEYHGSWQIDLPSVEHAVDRGTRAILVVSPNNPTGSYTSRQEAERLMELCSEHGLALIADEVFVDYTLDARGDRATDLAAQQQVLAFSLGGLSKGAGLPQIKLGWIVAGGPERQRTAALAALEFIADSYLPVSSPVQLAAPALISDAHVVRDQIHARVRTNLEQLQTLAGQHASCELLRTEGGWSAVVRVPNVGGEERLLLDLLDRERVLVHSGYFFDFPREAYLVMSLLPTPNTFADAAARTLALAAS